MLKDFLTCVAWGLVILIGLAIGFLLGVAGLIKHVAGEIL